MRPFAGPALPRLVQHDALRRAAACEKAARGSAEERWPDRAHTHMHGNEKGELDSVRLHLCLRLAARFG